MICLQAKIVARVSGGNACVVQADGSIRGGNDFQDIGNRHGEKDGLYIMKSIFPLLKDTEAYIDLAVGKCYHDEMKIGNLAFPMVNQPGPATGVLTSFPPVDLVPDGGGLDVVFMFQYLVQQRLQFRQG